MSAQNAQSCIHLLKALGDETRWKIVRELLSQTLTVTELTDLLKISQYNASKHLRILREAGIIDTVKQGRFLKCSVHTTFRQQLSKNKDQLDLGCCTFRFDKLPK
ncbi:MAG: putative Transcriptional regulator, ArsR family [Verrucomicrobiales bacterium]|nr:putative Transcriptional regulator, ArsR family [Verrucomicrobiales bacterium]